MGLSRRLVAIGAAAVMVPHLAVAATPASAKPQRIMSMNMCTDLLLLQLVPKDRIAAVTYLANDGARTLFPGRAAGIPIDYGTSEDILKFKPDLILAGDFSTAMTKKLARWMGAPIVEVKGANTFADIRRIVNQVGVAVGEPARAQALIRQMDANLAGLAARPPKARLRVVAWSGGISVPGKESLTNAIIEAAGATNVAAKPGVNDTTFNVEQLLIADPDALMFGGAPSGKPSLRSDEGKHRVVRQIYGQRRIAYNEVAYSCGLPQSAEAAVALRRALDALPERKGRWR